MKKLFFTLCILGMLFSCSSDDDIDSSTLVGTWKLSEINNDPGDGSGTMNPIESNKNLVFGDKNIVSSNGNIVVNSINSDSPSSGTYVLDEGFTTSGVISSSESGLTNTASSARFEMKEKALYVYYQCIEGCTAKFTKIK